MVCSCNFYFHEYKKKKKKRTEKLTGKFSDLEESFQFTESETNGKLA